jgi:hypothetical protein
LITDKGKSIVGKYLLGQTPAFASYIAIGCGPKPIDTDTDIVGDYSSKKNLDFEMLRVPISSRGFVSEGGIDKIVFTAELPAEERYEITEVGIFSAKSNPSAGANDSKTVFSFTTGENWNYHTSSSSTEITPLTEALDTSNNNIIATSLKVFQSNADNSIFYKTSRAERYERCRFLNNVIFMRGDDATLTLSDGHFNIGTGSNHIHYTKPNANFGQNSLTDELRLAFSLVSKDGASATVPDTVRVLVDFAATDDGSGEYARFEAELINGTDPGEYDFTTNRYFVISKELQGLYTSANFTWDAVTVVKIYASTLFEKVIDQKSLTSNVATIRTVSNHGLSIGNVVTVTGVDSTFNGEYTVTGIPTAKSFTYAKTYSGTITTTDVIPSGTVSFASSNYYVALDAMRLENITITNPLYGLVGYSVIQNTTGDSIVKSPNTSNYVEFRFSIGVT